MTSTTLVLFLVCTVNVWRLCGSLSNNAALTPPMGWSPWGRFRCEINCKRFPQECISEWLFRDMADRLAEDGYLEAGYNYLILDDCWLAKHRDPEGRLQPDPVRFPSGLRNLSDYVHSRGLKFGIYEDYGTHTCQGYPGIQMENIETDIKSIIEWNVDYIKLDACYSDPMLMEKGFSVFGNCLLQTGHSIVYSCSWPAYQVSLGIAPNYSFISETCNLWRNFRDIQDSWESVLSIINYYADHQEVFAPYAGSGRWNDPDMLIVGNFGLSFEQAKVQMSLWAVLSAPLIMSNDLRTIHPDFKQILLNAALIKVNQDSLGVQGRRILHDRKEKFEVWLKPVQPVLNNLLSWIIAIVNLDDCGEPKTIIFPLKFAKLDEIIQHYRITNLFDCTEVVELSSRLELITRIPPLASLLYECPGIICLSIDPDDWNIKCRQCMQKTAHKCPLKKLKNRFRGDPSKRRQPKPKPGKVDEDGSGNKDTGPKGLTASEEALLPPPQLPDNFCDCADRPKNIPPKPNVCCCEIYKPLNFRFQLNYTGEFKPAYVPKARRSKD